MDLIYDLQIWCRSKGKCVGCMEDVVWRIKPHASLQSVGLVIVLACGRALSCWKRTNFFWTRFFVFLEWHHGHWLACCCVLHCWWSVSSSGTLCMQFLFHLTNKSSCLNNLWGMMIKATKELSPIDLNSTFYSFNAAFPPQHFHTKSVYFGPIYLPLHFWKIFLKKPVYLRKCTYIDTWFSWEEHNALV